MKPPAAPTASAPDSVAVKALVPFAHVADVDASTAFYALLGFAPTKRMAGPDGRAFWAAISSALASIMFAQADGPVHPEQQAVLFYMYSNDVAGLRRHLLASGLADGGAYCGQLGPQGGRRVVFEVAHPPHMPHGELRVSDPDGYCILVGQLAAG